MSNQDKRVGTINPDGSRVWPEVNLTGGAYERGHSVYNLDAAHFVVLPMNFDARVSLDAGADITPAEKALAELQAKYPPPTSSGRKAASDGV